MIVRGPKTAAGYVGLGHVSPSLVPNPSDRLACEDCYLELDGRLPFSSFVERSFGLSKADLACEARKVGLGDEKLAHRNASRESGWGPLYGKIVEQAPKKDRKRPYQECYQQPELRDSVTQFYAGDLERFEYRFDGTFPSQPISCANTQAQS